MDSNCSKTARNKKLEAVAFVAVDGIKQLPPNTIWLGGYKWRCQNAFFRKGWALAPQMAVSCTIYCDLHSMKTTLSKPLLYLYHLVNCIYPWFFTTSLLVLGLGWITLPAGVITSQLLKPPLVAWCKTTNLCGRTFISTASIFILYPPSSYCFHSATC